MTDQELFDTVVSHLRRQGVKSSNEDGECLYRGPGGLKCAVGCLIPDEVYESTFEGYGVSPEPAFLIKGGERWRFEAFFDNSGINRRLAATLQCVHDDNDVCHWERIFRAVSEEFGLSYAPPAEGGAA